MPLCTAPDLALLPMSINLEPTRLREQEKRLHRLFPTLKNISCNATPLACAPMDAISKIIADAWQRAYGNRIRIVYTPEFLRYCLGCDTSRGLAISAYAGDQLQGVILGLPLEIHYHQEKVSSVLTTGLCVTESWEHSGLVELLMVKYSLALHDMGIQCSFHWRAAKTMSTCDAGRRLAQAASIRLYARALHIRRTGIHGKLSLWEQTGLFALNVTYRIRCRFSLLPKNYQFKTFAQKDGEVCAAFLNNLEKEHVMSLCITPEQLAWNCAYSEGNIRAAGWVLSQAGAACAIAWGYKNPVANNDAYFSMDRVAFSPALDLAVKRAFMAQVENAIRNQLDCFAILMPESSCEIPPEDLGYQPVKSYYLGASDIGMVPTMNISDLTGMPLPLR